MRREPNPESGYALLLIFSMAAILAIMLYYEVPRVAFEAQRDKEQLLVDRGNEYARAVALFVRKFNRFPGSMDELANTNGQRFLRNKFVDPMTGKTDWRILHAGPGGVITDSVTSKKTDTTGSTPQNFITDLGVTANSLQNNSEGVNIATRRRPSDGTTDTGESSSGNNSNSYNPIAGYNGPVMVLPDGRIVPANSSGTAPPPVGASGATSPMPGMAPGQQIPGQQIPGQAPLPSGVAVQQGLPGSGPNPAGPPNQAANLINQILTTPRPAGINGVPGTPPPPAAATTNVPTGGASPAPQAQQAQQQVIGAGIAGVASTKEQEGIKTINDRTKYNEWEFVYDITKDPARNGRGAQGGTGNQGPGRGGQNPTGAPSGVTPAMPGMGAPMTPSGPGR